MFTVKFKLTKHLPLKNLKGSKTIQNSINCHNSGKNKNMKF